MYHASTVLTGSEMPALTSIGCCAVAGLQPTRTRARTAAQTRTQRAWIFVGIVTPLALLVTLRQPRRPQNSRNSRPNPAMRSSTPQRRSASHTIAWCAAITLTPNSRSSASIASAVGQCGDGNRIESASGCSRMSLRPISSAAWLDAPDLVERAAPAGRTQHLAAEMGTIARDSVGLAQLVGLRHHHLLAAEGLGGSRLRRRAGRDLDLQLGLEVDDHPLRVGVALRQVDGNAAEHDDVHAGRRHLARGLHAD